MAGHDFASAFAMIMEQPVKKDPILSQNQGFAGEIKKRRLEHKVEEAYLDSRRAIRERFHKIPDPHDNILKEKQLKKAATVGVVQLFNAINNQQRNAAGPSAASEKAARRLNALSKEKFLEELKHGASSKKTFQYSRAPVRKEEGTQRAPWLQEDFDFDDEPNRYASGALDVPNDESI